MINNLAQNWATLLANDPGLIAFKGASTEALSNAATKRSAALRSLAIQHGGLPAGFKDPYGDLNDPVIQDQMQNNPYSDIAQNQRARVGGYQDLTSSLAARGALHSGELLSGASRLNYDLGKNEYDQGNTFAGNYNTALQGYGDTVSEQKRQEATAIGAAAKSVYDNPMNRVGGVGGTVTSNTGSAGAANPYPGLSSLNERNPRPGVYRAPRPGSPLARSLRY